MWIYQAEINGIIFFCFMNYRLYWAFALFLVAVLALLMPAGLIRNNLAKHIG